MDCKTGLSGRHVFHVHRNAVNKANTRQRRNGASCGERNPVLFIFDSYLTEAKFGGHRTELAFFLIPAREAAA